MMTFRTVSACAYVEHAEQAFSLIMSVTVHFEEVDTRAAQPTLACAWRFCTRG